MKTLSYFLFAFFFTLISCSNASVDSKATNSDSNKDGVVSATQFEKQLENNWTLIDVRTPDEFNAGHIEKAINHNFYDDNFSNQFAQYDKKKPVMVYCKSGGRSGKTYKILKDMGFSEVYDLQGGYSKWPKK